MSDLIDALVIFTDTYPEVIPNLRAAHRPGRHGYCQGCPGLLHERCQYLRMADEVEARKAHPASPPPTPLAPRIARRGARAAARRR